MIKFTYPLQLLVIALVASHASAQTNRPIETLNRWSAQKTQSAQTREDFPYSLSSQDSTFGIRLDIKPDKGQAKRFYKQGVKYGLLKMYTQAMAAFLLAIQLNPDYEDAYFGLGHAYFDMERWQDAINSFNRVLQLNPRDREAQVRLRESYSKLRAERNNLSQETKSVEAKGAAMGERVSLPQKPNTRSETSKNATNGIFNKSIEPVSKSKSTTPAGLTITKRPAMTNGREPAIVSVVPASSKAVALPKQPVSSDPAKRATVDTNTKATANRVPYSAKDPASNSSAPTFKASKSGSDPVIKSTTNRVPNSVGGPVSNSPAPTFKSGSASKPASKPTLNLPVKPAVSIPQTSFPLVPPVASNNAALAITPLVNKEKPAGSPAQPTPAIAMSTRSSLKVEAPSPADIREDGSGVISAPKLDQAGVTAASVSGEASSAASGAKSFNGVSTVKLANVAPTQIYRVGVGDILDVRVHDQRLDQSGVYTVTPNGLLEYPILGNPLKVVGLTPEQIGENLENELRRLALSDSSDVLVGVREYNSHTILISGQVREPGTKVLRREAIPLYVILADAQPLPEAGRVMVISHETGEVSNLALSEPGTTGILIRPGDVIIVHPNPKLFYYIGGEVKAPGEKPFRKGLTLTQGILTAGGTIRKPETVDVELAREGTNGFLTVSRYKLKQISSGKLPDPLLQPGDRITVMH